MADRLRIAPRHRRILEALLREHLPGVEVWAYGSRVNGRGHDGSDLDLVLRKPDLQKFEADQLRGFEDAVRESTIPFLVDVHDWARLPERFHREIEGDYVVMSDSPAPAPNGRSAGDGDSWQTIDRAGGNWSESLLGDLTDNFDAVRVPVKRTERVNGPYPYYGASGVVDHVSDYLFDGEYLLLAEDGENLRTRRTPIAFLATGKFWVNNHAHVVQGNQRSDTRFLMYALQQLDISGYLTGSTMPKLTQDNMNRIRLLAPLLDEQRSIAHVLGTLDDKIELNRRINATLEAIARALFKSWFVDFDPVRAKMEGRDTGLSKEVTDLFPDRLVDSELGEIPEGWLVESLGKHFEAMKGVSYKGSGLNGDGVPLHNLNSILEGGGYKYDGIKFYSGEHKDRHRVRPGDVIVANTEQGHDRLLIGYAAIVPGAFGTDGIATHHIYRLRSRPASWLSTRFLLFLLNSGRMHDLVSGYANGTTVNMLPIDGVQRPHFAVPPKALVETFDLMVSCSENRREHIVRESRILAVVRDTLLPKLISGELKVRDDERLFKTAASRDFSRRMRPTELR